MVGSAGGFWSCFVADLSRRSRGAWGLQHYETIVHQGCLLNVLVVIVTSFLLPIVLLLGTICNVTTSTSRPAWDYNGHYALCKWQYLAMK